MDFQDIAFCPPVFTMFLKNCGRGESFGTTTCLRTVSGGGREGHATCRILLFQQITFLCQSNVIEFIRLLQG